ncbi:MAG: hypothetical protein RLY31_242 [Bacteroidota bacterium]|jgi:O-antigen/teichoic acid export membrane protein
MGVVKRQGILQSIVTYLGVAIGAVNTLWIYPAFLTKEEIGIINYVRESAGLLTLLTFLGSSELIIRFFPYFRNEREGHHGFLFLLACILLSGNLVLLAGYHLGRAPLHAYFGAKDNPDLYLAYLWMIPVLTFLASFSSLFALYASNFHRIVVPSAINEFLPKIGIPLMVIAYQFRLLDLDGVFRGILLVYLLITLSQAAYLRSIGQLHFRPDRRLLSGDMLKEMGRYMLFGFLGGMGSRLSSEFINIVMVGTMTTLRSTGVFVIAYFISNVVDIPRKAIARITAPLLADKWKQGDLAEIATIYRKSSLNQLIVGTGMFLSIWIGIEQLYALMPNGETFLVGREVVGLLGIARLIDMATGVNSEIISYSRHYRYNLYFIGMTSLIHIGANLWLVPSLGITGVGVATILSLSFFNLSKLLLIHRKFGMQPFSRASLYTLILATAAYAAASRIPTTGFPLLDLLLLSGGFASLFALGVLGFKISPDINALATGLWGRIFRQHNE